MRKRQETGRRLISFLWGWPWLLASPSGYLLVLGLGLTAVAKLRVYASLEHSADSILGAVAVLAPDVTVYLGLAALCALGERRVRRLLLLTVPVAGFVFVFAAVNAATLSITGEQITRVAIVLGLERFADVWNIVLEQARHLGPFRLAGIVLVAAVFPVGLGRLLARSRGAGRFRRNRVWSVALIGLLALLVWVLLPRPTSPPVRRLAGSALLQLLRGGPAAEFGGRAAEPGLPEEASRAAGPARGLRRGGTFPNVVLFVLESARYDRVTLPGTEASGKADTPNLLRLAREGTWARAARAEMPHTTKSLYAMLCGRLPAMSRHLFELAPESRVGCLPGRLSEAGYRTAFLQTAIGAFEQRPRLVHNLGYEQFEAWEEIQGEPLGYLASDDESLAEAFERWLEAMPQEDRPFFVTLLTSATHHPYRLSRRAVARLGGLDPETLSDEERYVRLIEAKDFLIGSVLETLERRGLYESTIVAVAGDHGEGFGAKGVRQHDNNFYEEGLHVPLVIAGPGVPRMVIDRNIGLADLAPTMLELLGLAPIAGEGPRFGTSLYSNVDAPSRRYFACWYDGYCYGFVEGDRKIVVVPSVQESFYFDLSRDPLETSPLPLPPGLEQAVGELRSLVASTLPARRPGPMGPAGPYGDWSCPPGEPCTHPDTPEGRFFEPPANWW